MKLKLSTVAWTFVWCIFMGITVGSIGLGAIFPAANRITAPFVCSGGKLDLVTQDYHPSPVETVTTLTWYCVDANTGARQEVSVFKMALIAGPLYGLLLFLIVMEVMWIRADRHGPTDTPLGHQELLKSPARNSAQTDDMLRRPAELHHLAAATRESLRQPAATNAAFLSQPDSESLEQRLQELKHLHDSGLITEQDYARKKRELLNDL